jgi:Ca-activated chloride channel family protein
LFGTQAYVQAPLTYDVDTIQQLLDEAEIGFAGEKTAIGDAIGLALKRLQQRASDSRVLILLSDGADTASQVKPMQAAKLAAQEDMRIYTVGIGADEMIQRSLFGNRRVNPSMDLDEKLLQDVANTTGGSYFRARNVEDLQKIYAQINALEPIEQEGESFRPEQSLLHLPLALALALLTLLALAQASFWQRVR